MTQAIALVATGQPAWAAAVRELEALPADEADAVRKLHESGSVVIDGALEEPLAAARRIRALDEQIQVLIAADAERKRDLERKILLTPGLGELWVVPPENLNDELFSRAAKVTAQRRSYSRTRKRLHDFATTGPAPPAPRTRISDAYLATLLQVVADPVLSIDQNDGLLSMNPAAERVLRSAAAGTHIEEIICPTDPVRLADLLRRGTQRLVRGEVEYRSPGGSRRSAEVAVSPVESREHQIRAVVVHDVTEERAVREQLEEQAAELEQQAAQLQEQAGGMQAQAEELIARNERLTWLAAESDALLKERDRALADVRHLLASRSRFYASMSHELRTPINAVLGYNDLLLAGVYGELQPEQIAGIERVQKAAHHLLELVNDVLDLSKIESGRIGVEPEEVVLAELIEDLVATIAPVASGHGSEIQLRLEGCPRTVITDPRRLRQILMNLLSNAAKFGEGRPIEVVCAGADPGFFAIEVIDHGVGIQPDDLDLIFEEFIQIGETGNSGTGLGLPISRRLADLLGGGLSASSEPGAGSTFRVHLPLRTERVSQGAGPQLAPGAAPGSEEAANAP